jgi:hypothetical protein
MRQLRTLLLVFFLAAASKLEAQKCIDTVRIKGYYIVMRLKNEITSPNVEQKDTGTKILQLRIDEHYETSFIPLDSIKKQHDLTYWLNHFWINTKQVFVSCEKVNLKHLVSNCLLNDTVTSGICLFPDLKSDTLYETNLNTGEVFEIYYLDACWARIKIKKGTIAETMIPSRIAEISIDPSLKEFDLYYFLRIYNHNVGSSIKQDGIAVLRKNN